MKLHPHTPPAVPARGRFTLPTEAGRDDLVRELADKWGADAVRDSDGTELSPELLELGFEVFSTVLLTRADQAFARAHPEFLIRKFSRSDPVLAESATVEIRPLDGFDPRKYRTDARNEPKSHWQVFDRATGLEHPPQLWDYDAARDTVTIRGAIPWHPYTVNFLVEQIWDSTSMHNHLTNHWTCDSKMGIDIHSNACEGGVVLRRCAEAPGRQTKELRFYPQKRGQRSSTSRVGEGWIGLAQAELGVSWAVMAAHPSAMWPLFHCMKRFPRRPGKRRLPGRRIAGSEWVFCECPPSGRVFCPGMAGLREGRSGPEHGLSAAANVPQAGICY